MASPETEVPERCPDSALHKKGKTRKDQCSAGGTGSHLPGSLLPIRHQRGEESSHSRQWTAEDTRRGPAHHVAEKQPHPGPKQQPELALGKTAGHRSLWLGTKWTDIMPCEMSRNRAPEAMLPQEVRTHKILCPGEERGQRRESTSRHLNLSIMPRGWGGLGSVTQEGLSFEQGAEPLPNGDAVLGAHRLESSD